MSPTKKMPDSSIKRIGLEQINQLCSLLVNNMNVRHTKQILNSLIELLNVLHAEHNNVEWKTMWRSLNGFQRAHRGEYQFQKAAVKGGTTLDSWEYGKYKPFTEMEIADIKEAEKVKGQIAKLLREIKKANKEGA